MTAQPKGRFSYLSLVRWELIYSVSVFIAGQFMLRKHVSKNRVALNLIYFLQRWYLRDISAK